MLVYGASVPKKRDQTWTKRGRLQTWPMEHVLYKKIFNSVENQRVKKNTCLTHPSFLRYPFTMLLLTTCICSWGSLMFWLIFCWLTLRGWCNWKAKQIQQIWFGNIQTFRCIPIVCQWPWSSRIQVLDWTKFKAVKDTKPNWTWMTNSFSTHNSTAFT